MGTVSRKWGRKLLETDRSVWDWLLRHGLYWFFFTVLVALSWMYWFGSFQETLEGVIISGLPLYLSTTYLFLYFVLPKLMDEHFPSFAFRFVIWLGASFLLRYFFMYFLYIELSQTAFTDNPLRNLFDTSFMLTNNFVFMAAALKLFRYHYRKEQANQQLAQETLLIELQMLKAQVHPHFLFNTLNNIYSLTLRQSDRAGEAVRKLSALLRYMFKECDRPEVSLSQEVDLLRNYIELEQFRYGHRLTVTLTIEGELANKPIAPLVLIPFIENAFKHGASEQTDQAFIDVTISIINNELIFKVINSKNRHCNPLTKPNGLGLENVQKRLRLLYPDRHTLAIHAEETQYRVELAIYLNSVPASIPSERFRQQPVSESSY